MNVRTRVQEYPLTGTPRYVAAEVARLRQQAMAAGEPYGMTLLEERGDGKVSAVVTIGTPAVATQQASTPRGVLAPGARKRLVIGGAVVTTTSAAGAWWIISTVVTWIGEHLALVIGGVVVVIAAAGVVLWAHGSEGHHWCPLCGLLHHR